MAETAALESVQTEVQATSEGLPQLEVFKDGSYTSQVIWLFITFFLLYFLVSRLVLPRVGQTLEEREDRIRADLDKAEECRGHASQAQEAYAADLNEARLGAQKILGQAKDDIQKRVSEATTVLDQELSSKLGDAEMRIDAARSEALSGLRAVAADVTGDLVKRLSGHTVENSVIDAAVSNALQKEKEV